MTDALEPGEATVAGQPPPTLTRRRRWLLALYRRLGADPAPPPRYTSRWPTTRQGFLWDLLPKEPAPDNDGVVAPEWSPPEWVDEVHESQLPQAIGRERQLHREQQDSVATVEAKASRLLTPTVALLAATVALTGFELKAVAGARTFAGALLPLIGALAGVVAVVLLFIAVLRALDADTRMGVYRGATTQTLVREPREELAAEALGSALASWVRRKKATRLMEARSAVSKAILALAIALPLGGITIVTREDSPPNNPAMTPAPTTTPTARPSHAPSHRKPSPAPSRIPATPTPTRSH